MNKRNDNCNRANATHNHNNHNNHINERKRVKSKPFGLLKNKFVHFFKASGERKREEKEGKRKENKEKKTKRGENFS